MANLGDAKAVLARASTSSGVDKSITGDNQSLKGVVITKEHKAIFPLERARIEKVGLFDCWIRFFGLKFIPFVLN